MQPTTGRTRPVIGLASGRDRNAPMMAAHCWTHPRRRPMTRVTTPGGGRARWPAPTRAGHTCGHERDRTKADVRGAGRTTAGPKPALTCDNWTGTDEGGRSAAEMNEAMQGRAVADASVLTKLQSRTHPSPPRTQRLHWGRAIVTVSRAPMICHERTGRPQRRLRSDLI